MDDNFPEIEKLMTFDPITLEEMDGVQLMNRTDTKFVFSRKLFNEFLDELKTGYRVLDVNGHRISRYRTLYFDTEKHQFYLDHHNGRLSRYKVRIRNYIESNLYFLEIKHKFKGRTNKQRIRIQGFEEDLSPESMAFIEEVMGTKLDLNSSLWNTFGRITLVSKTDKERLTIDLNLSFEKGEEETEYDHFVIAELKQEDENRNSLFYRLMKKNLIRPTGMSKYCLGTFTMNPSIKHNNFKGKELLINKLERA